MKMGDWENRSTAYDENSNLNQDKNKDISTISYNHLNLPYLITLTGKGTIKYIYDAAGNKLEKRTVETSPQSKTTNTAYLNGYVYENNVLQYFGHEEGRVRKVGETGSPVYVYDYFLKDHLGNTRVVLTGEQKTDAYPVASLESSTITNEKLYYNIPDDGATRVNKSTVAGYPTDSYTNPNEYIQKLNGNGTKIGTSITLKVMSGDSYNIRANSWYRNNGASPATPVSPLNSIISALSNGIVGTGATKATAAALQSSNTLDPAITNFLNNQTNIATRPKAYLNWILLDACPTRREQFKYVNGGYEQVGDNEEFKTHTQTGLPISRNGYLYVYVSNETPNIDVFIDNMQVTHTRGPLIQESHHYMFGLEMAGISSKAAGSLVNKDKTFQGQRFDDELDLNWYQYRFRSYDQQIGRFIQVDPLAPKYTHNSTYAFAENKVTMGIDLEGLDLLPFNSAWFRSVSQNTPTNGQRVQVVALNVPTVFKDATGNPLFSASSVGVTPKGVMADKGEQIRPGNNLPSSPKYAWSLDAQPTASTSGGKVGNNFDNNQAFADKMGGVASAPQEINNWIQTFKDGGSVDIWNAYGELRTNINSFDKATKSIGAIPFGMTTKDTQRGDLINFVNDGTIPMLDFKNLQQSLQFGMQIMQTGMEVMNKNKISIRGSTNETYQLYRKLLEFFNSPK
jgi:RHS repeat-associated protein